MTDLGSKRVRFFSVGVLYLRPIQRVPLWGAGVVVTGLSQGRTRGAADRVIQDFLFCGRDLPLTQDLPSAHTSVTAPAAF